MKRHAIVLMGCAGLGKEYVGKSLLRVLPSSFDYKSLSQSVPPYALRKMQQESGTSLIEDDLIESWLRLYLRRQCLSSKHPILDGVVRSPKQLLIVIDELKGRGITPHIVHVTANDGLDHMEVSVGQQCGRTSRPVSMEEALRRYADEAPLLWCILGLAHEFGIHIINYVNVVGWDPEGGCGVYADLSQLARQVQDIICA